VAELRRSSTGLEALRGEQQQLAGLAQLQQEHDRLAPLAQLQQQLRQQAEEMAADVADADSVKVHQCV
jgi:hypothetical protein